MDLIWNQPFQLIEVNKIPDDELPQHKWAGILELFMKQSLKRDFLVRLSQFVGILHELELAGGEEYVITLLNYSMESAESEDIEQFVDIIKHGLSSDLGDKIMTIAEQFVQRGIQKGYEQGIQRGAIVGEKLLLTKLLNRRFTHLPSKYLNQIDQADTNTLLLWGEKILDAEKIEDIFNES